jgi:hypothetical protein
MSRDRIAGWPHGTPPRSTQLHGRGRLASIRESWFRDTLAPCIAPGRSAEGRRLHDGGMAASLTLSLDKLESVLRAARLSLAKGRVRSPCLRLPPAPVRRSHAAPKANSARSRWVRQEGAQAAWPVRAVSGDSALGAAWLILQHSHDPTWQSAAAGEPELLARSGELSQQECGLLSHRALEQRGLPQRYGTQRVQRNGRVVAAPIEDLAVWNAPRAKVGVLPVAEYVRKRANV